MPKATKTVIAPVAESAVVVESTPVVKKEKKAAAKKDVAAVVAEVAPVVEKAVAEVVPVVEKAVKKEKKAVAKKEEVAAAPAPVEVAPVAEAPQQEAVNIDTIVAKVKTFMALGGEILRDVRTLEKSHSRELKAVQKAGQKKKRKSSNPNQSSGFKKPSEISVELADFLGVARGSTMSHLQATQGINSYIKANDLQNKDKATGGGRVILADEKLRKLFGLSSEVVANGGLSYFNLQTHIAPHFKKSAAASAVATASASA